MQKNNIRMPSSQEKKISTPENDEDNPSYWQMMIDGIVRPPRAKYSEDQLGKQIFKYQGKTYLREEHQILHENKKIQLTILSPFKSSKYLILYMHGNSSCRVEAISLFRYLPPQTSLGCFDFMGCGKNQQMQTISLGYRESAQAATIVQYLQKKGYRVIIWGRSMGAATALLYGKVPMIIADSSFKSFKSLCKQVAKEYSPTVVPDCMVTCFFPCFFRKLKKDVDKKANYNVEQLDVREAVKKLDPETQVIFMSGDTDSLIAPRNSKKLYDICPAKRKHLKIFAGDHNSKRPEETMKEVMKLIHEFIQKDSKNEDMQIEIKPIQSMIKSEDDKTHAPE